MPKQYDVTGACNGLRTMTVRNSELGVAPWEEIFRKVKHLLK